MLTSGQRAEAQAYMRELVQQGLNRDEVLALTKEYMRTLQSGGQPQPQPQPRRQAHPQPPQQQQPKLRKARESTTGRIVLVNEHNQIVRYLS